MVRAMNKIEYYRCFSGKQKNFLLEQGHDYLLKAKDCLSLKEFWLFIKDNDNELDKSLKLWTNTNPNKFKG